MMNMVNRLNKVLYLHLEKLQYNFNLLLGLKGPFWNSPLYFITEKL